MQIDLDVGISDNYFNYSVKREQTPPSYLHAPFLQGIRTPCYAKTLDKLLPWTE